MMPDPGPRPRYALPTPDGPDPALFDPCRFCGGTGRVLGALEDEGDHIVGDVACPACGGSGAMPDPAAVDRELYDRAGDGAPFACRPGDIDESGGLG